MPSGRGYGRGGSSEGGSCKTMCPRIVLPTPGDFEQIKRYQIERELHGGPFGEDTMNPFYQRPDVANAGHWSGIKRPVVSMMLPGSFPLISFMEVESMLKQDAQRRQRQEVYASTERFGTTQKNHFYKIKPHYPRGQGFNKHAPCYHICAKAERDPRADMDPFGGPFGPDPYYASRTGHFKTDTWHAGSFMFNGHSVRNFQNEAFGGPFGADPFFEFGRKQKSAGMPTYGYPPT